jgi:hypothetical protein
MGRRQPYLLKQLLAALQHHILIQVQLANFSIFIAFLPSCISDLRLGLFGFCLKINIVQIFLKILVIKLN